MAPVKAVGSFVPGLTRKAFEKFGFSTATLLTDWAQIAGADLAGYTTPDRLKWPRATPLEEELAEGGARRGATLMLRVDPARALDVEYRARQIMERINAYFGYRAVETIRLIQAPIQSGSLPRPPCEGSREGRSRTDQRSDIPEGDPLAAALARLERGVRRDAATRRT